MSFITGLLSSFTESSRAARKDEADRLDKQQEREEKALAHLATSDDQEIAGAATTALLEMATGVGKRPKQGYLARLIGAPNEAVHPTVARVLQLAKSQVPETSNIPVYGPGQAQPPSMQSGGAAAMPPKPMGAGGGPESPAQLGGPTPTAPGGPPPPPPSFDVPVSTGMPPSFFQNQERIGTITHSRMVPRKLFLSPAERLRQNAVAKSAGDVEGEVAGLVAAGFTDIEARGLVKQKYERQARLGGAAGMTWAEGEVVQNPEGGWEQVLYLRSDPTKQMRIPATAPTLKSTRTVAQDEQDAAELFGTDPKYAGKPPAVILQSLTPDERTRLFALQNSRGIQSAGGRAGAAATAQQAAVNQGQLGRPIGVATGANQGLDPTTTLGELRGIVPVTPEQRERLQAATNLAEQMVPITALTAKVFPDRGGLIGGLTAAASLAYKRTTRDPELAALEAAIGTALANMSRVLSGERGTLNEGDIQRAQAALTNLQASLLSGDTKESALARLDVVNAAIAKVKNSIKTPTQQIQGRPPGGPPAPPGSTMSPPPSRRAPNVPPAADEYTGEVRSDQAGQDWGQVGGKLVALELYTTPDGRVAWRVRK